MGREQFVENADRAARAWRASLGRELRQRSDLHGGTIFVVSAALYLLTFLGTFLLPLPWERLLALVIQPIVIGALFIIAHDACHGSLMHSGFLNRLIGRLCILPSWHPFTAWAHTHNSMHHGWTNFKGRHPDFPPFSKAEYDRLPRWRQWLERCYRSPLGVGPYYTIDFYFKHMLFPSAEHRSPHRRAYQLDRLLVAVFFALQMWAAWALAEYTPDRVVPAPVLALLGVFVPWMLWIWFQGFVSFIQHTHPRIAWYDKEDEWSFYHVQLKSTTHIIFPWPIERILHNIMDHAAHHLDPTIPLYHLPQSQRKLEESCSEHAVVVYWTPMDYLRTCAACKLYDFERHCWLNFNGEPTTPVGLSGDMSRVKEEAAAPVFSSRIEDETEVDHEFDQGNVDEGADRAGGTRGLAGRQ